MATGHRNDVDTVRAYGAPSVSSVGISEFRPITAIGSAQEYNVPSEDLGRVTVKRAKALFGDLCQSPFSSGFGQLRDGICV